MGATGLGYDLAGQFGLAIRQPRPALVPLIFGEQDRNHYSDLAGVSSEVVVSCDGQRFRDKMLITHRGLSGPAVLQISSYWQHGREIVIDLAPQRDILVDNPPVVGSVISSTIDMHSGAKATAIHCP
jgi:predicted flavoprotein YhiN